MVFELASLAATHSSLAFVRRLVLGRADPQDTGLPAPGSTIAVPRDVPPHLRGREWDVVELSASRLGDVIVLHGLGGVGKTALAATVAAGWHDSDRQVFWIDCREPHAIADSMRAAARSAGMDGVPSEPIADVVWGHLDRPRDAPWLIVFDNVDDPVTLSGGGRAVAELTGWLRPARHGVVLVTSRNRDTASWGPSVTLREARALSAPDGARILRDLAPDATADDAATVALSEYLGNLPLALRIAGSYLASPLASHGDARAYLTTLRDERPRNVDLEAPDVYRTLRQTWEIALRALDRAGLPQARRMLWLLSLIEAGSVRLDFLRLAASAPVPLSGLRLSERRFRSLISQMHAVNLVTVERTTAAAVVDIHPLVAEAYGGQARRGLRALRILAAVLWAVAEEKNMPVPALGEVFAFAVDGIHEARHLRGLSPVMGRRAQRELVRATARLSFAHANEGDVATANYYLAITEVLIGAVPIHTQFKLAEPGRSTFLPFEPPSPAATGPAWPAIWLAADRRYSEALRYCDAVLERRTRWGLTEAEVFRVRRVSIDLSTSAEGWSRKGHFAQYKVICAFEDEDTDAVSEDDCVYTDYLARCFDRLRHLSFVDEPAVRLRLQRIRDGKYEPLYWRRRLRRVPTVDALPELLTRQSHAIRFSGIFWTGHRNALLRIRTLLELQYYRLSAVRAQSDPVLPREDVEALARTDPRWRVTLAVVRYLDDARLWPYTRRSGMDWLSLLDYERWNSGHLCTIKFMASLTASHYEFNPIYSVFCVDPSRFQLLMEALRIWHDPLAVPNQGIAQLSPEIRERARSHLTESSDIYSHCSYYLIGIVNNDRIWSILDEGVEHGDIYWPRVLQEAGADPSITESQRTLLSLGAALFNSDFLVNLHQVVAALDGHGLEVAIHAMRILHEQIRL